jgi:hypothetical protein
MLGAQSIQPFDQFRDSLHAETPPSSAADSPDAFEEMRSYLLDLYDGVEVPHSFLESGGHVVDCIPVEQQPSLRKSGLKPLSPPAEPLVPKAHYGVSPIATGEYRKAPPPQLHPDYRDPLGNRMWCPDGTVPMIRLTMRHLARSPDVGTFLRGPKAGPDYAKKTPDPQVPTVAPSASPKRYAVAKQELDNLGGYSFINIWQPQVFGTGATISQQWYETPPAPFITYQSVECGYQIGGGNIFDSKPRLFVYHTNNGHVAGSGGYFTGFEKRPGASAVLGGALVPSVPGGAQFDYEMGFHLTEGAWWLWFNGEWIGCYRISLFQAGPLATSAGRASWGGESHWSGVFPPIGSGRFPDAGWGHAAYQRNVTIMPRGGPLLVATLTANQQFPNCYNTVIANNSPSTWDTYFLFGGPGGITC